MWGSLDAPFDGGFAIMKDALAIEPEFQTFHKFCLNNKIPFNVISAGLKPVLRRVLDHFLGEEASSNIEIVANDATISSNGSEWKPVWLHDTERSHDKAQSINDYREHAIFESDDGTIPMTVFIGDGVSDLPAAREADVLFARRGFRLEEYCIEHKSPYVPFNTFADIQHGATKIAKIDEEKTKRQGLPAPTSREEYQARMQSQSSLLLLPEARRCSFGQISSHSTRLLWMVQLLLSRRYDCLSYR